MSTHAVRRLLAAAALATAGLAGPAAADPLCVAVDVHGPVIEVCAPRYVCQDFCDWHDVGVRCDGRGDPTLTKVCDTVA